MVMWPPTARLSVLHFVLTLVSMFDLFSFAFSLSRLEMRNLLSVLSRVNICILNLSSLILILFLLMSHIEFDL